MSPVDSTFSASIIDTRWLLSDAAMHISTSLTSISSSEAASWDQHCSKLGKSFALGPTLATKSTISSDISERPYPAHPLDPQVVDLLFPLIHLESGRRIDYPTLADYRHSVLDSMMSPPTIHALGVPDDQHNRPVYPLHMDICTKEKTGEEPGRVDSQQLARS
jgi:hypothetical protein